MKKVTFIILCFFGFTSLMMGCQEQSKEKSSLKVLYVGYNPERPMPDFGERYPNSASAERYKEIYKTRMPAFEEFLGKHFSEVRAIDARDYEASVSDSFDVTIFDARPEPIEPEIREYDDNGRVTKYKRARYLPQNFDKPVIFMTSMAPTMGNRLGLKLDWLCLCLDAHAHHIEKDHPIFNEPMDVELTMKKKPTPDGIFHYASGQDVPKQIPMWEVQTEGYKDGNGYMVGMVSRGGGFEDSPDAEYISSGVNTKDVGAVALGRHGNFFLWGFSGSPDYMTDEAKKVFANTVVYMDQFDGRQPIVRKNNTRIPTREAVDNYIYRTTHTAYAKNVEEVKGRNENTRQQLKEIKEKENAGKELTKRDKMTKQVGLTDIPTRKEYLQRVFPSDLFQKFGMDTLAYGEYFRQNRDYFYYDGSELVVDEQAKELGIPNNDDRILDRSIEMLENNTNEEMARTILQRYTRKDFNTSNAWRNWYESNKHRLFFTESGGYTFMVNSYKNETISSKKKQ